MFKKSFDTAKNINGKEVSLNYFGDHVLAIFDEAFKSIDWRKLQTADRDASET